MQAEASTVAVEELRRAMNKALDHLRDASGDTVELAHDYFWSVPSDELYDVYSRPTNLTVGQLTESWANLEPLRQGDGTVPGHALVWLADVMRALGHQTYR